MALRIAPSQHGIYHAFSNGHVVGAEPPTTTLSTHISHLWFGNTSVVKIPNAAIAEGWCDYGTLAQREAVCRAEAERNAPNAPGVYLGARCVVTNHSSLFALVPPSDINGHTPVDWAVVMRRLPAEACLETTLASGQSIIPFCDDIADAIYAMHERAGLIPFASGMEYARVTDDIFHELANRLDRTILAAQAAGLAVPSWSTLQHLQRSGMQPWQHQLADRYDRGAIRDCHGDLNIGNVWIENGTVLLLDGIAFNQGFVQIDRAKDIAFLSADLLLRGEDAAAHRIATRYHDRAPCAPALRAAHTMDRLMVRAFVHLDQAPNATGAARTEHTRLGCRALQLAEAQYRLAVA